MRRVGSRELKLHTGQLIQAVRRGERLLLTHRGSPVAVVTPLDHDAFERLVEGEADRAETLEWLRASESALSFWDNEVDAVWDQVEVR